MVKKEITKFLNKFYMIVNLPVEFNMEKYHLNCKYHIYKIKTMTETFSNTHLKVSRRF